MCGILGRPYRPDGGSHCRVKVCGVFCQKIYPLSEGYMCVCTTLSELSSTRRIACRKKMRLRSVGQWLCSYVCLYDCICEGIYLLVYIFDVSLLGPKFCSPLVISIRVRMFDLRTLGLGHSEGASGRLQINPIWRT